MSGAPRIATVGHSTRTFAELVELLREGGVEALVDVRRYPASRRNPQHAKDALAHELPREGIEYRHEPELGGRRAPRPDSPNGAWRNPQFRGYADHMASAAFEEALERTLELARTKRVAVMCAEAHPSQCHRKLIADAAVARGWEVLHLIAPGRVEAHELNADAQVLPEGRIVYPAKGGEPERGQGKLGFEG